MFEAKEQAKYYIEKIRTIGRSTNQTLLIVFIPLFFLYLTQIEPRYVFVEDWITQIKHIDSLKRKFAESRDVLFVIGHSIRVYNKNLDSNFKKEINQKTNEVEYVTLKSSKIELLKKSKKEKAKLSALKMKSYAISDSIKLNLLKLIFFAFPKKLFCFPEELFCFPENPFAFRKN